MNGNPIWSFRGPRSKGRMRTERRSALDDVFTARTITAEEVKAFLRLGDHLDERPAEGVRLEYKSERPENLAKHVCALANTFGGLLLIGVDAPGGRPTGLPGVQK